MKIEFRGTTYNQTSSSCEVFEKCVPFVKVFRNGEECYEPLHKREPYKLYWRGSKRHWLKIYDCYRIFEGDIQ